MGVNMKKRMITSLIMVVLLFVTVGNLPMNVKANNYKLKNLDNEMKVVMDTTANKALTVGDKYKIQVSVADQGIDAPTSAEIYEYYISFDNSQDNLESFQATSVEHDDANKCYIITLEGTIKDEKAGQWYIFGVNLLNDSGQQYEICDKSASKFLNYRHFVVEQTPVTHLTINSCQQSLQVGDTFQLTATLVPSFEKPTVTWVCEDESIATVDADGKITAKAAGRTRIIAKYNEQECNFYFSVQQTSAETKSADTEKETANISISSEAANVSSETADASSKTVNVVSSQIEEQSSQINEETTQVSKEAPQTGDNSPLIYLAIAEISCCMVILISITKKKFRNE